MLLYTVIPPREIHVTDPKSGSSAGKESTCNAGGVTGAGWISGWGRSREGNSNPLQCSCLVNPRDRGDWWARVHRVAKNGTRLSTQTHKLCKQYFIIY